MSQLVLGTNKFVKRLCLQVIRPHNFTVVFETILGVEVSTIGEEIRVQEELEVSDILANQINHQKKSAGRFNKSDEQPDQIRSDVEEI